jgi:hypothetical protein
MIPFEAIIKGETNDSRFEKFCGALLQKSEGITIVPTSTTWDKGRDGVSIRSALGKTHAEVLCCTIEKDIDAKVNKDAKRLAMGTIPGHVYYCYSLNLSEHRIDTLSADFRSQMPSGCGITFLDSTKLSAISASFPDLFRQWYPGEVSSAEAALQAFRVGQQTTETRGLRLALLSFTSSEAKDLRLQITKRAVLDVLGVCGGCTAAVIAEKLSSGLGLPSPIRESYVHSILQTTTLQNLTMAKNGKWELTESGAKEAKSVPPEAAQEVLAGRRIVREALERLIGKRIVDSQYDLIWSSLLDFFSEYFYSSGLAIISAVRAALGENSSNTREMASLEKLIEEGAKKVGAHISTPELRAEIEQAIKDVFTERTGAAFDWLSRLCERFVALCALGLESTSSDEIRGILTRNNLVLDTDIVLTSLCESEPDHNAARELITRFREVGGKIALSSSVLEEVAYHAWIADREFKESIPLFGKLGPDDLRRYIRNTFVRAFFLYGWNDTAKTDQWDLYINQFKGITEHDYSKLVSVLQPSLLAERLPDLIDESLKSDVTAYMKESSAKYRGLPLSRLGQDEIGKAETDGKVIGSIGATRENLRQRGSHDTIVLLTSSPRLRRAGQQFKTRLGAPEAVISPAALSYLLSLIPGVNLGLSTLRRALFEFRDSGRLPDVQRLALKVLKSTGVYDVAWATRGTLRDHLHSELRSEANKAGQRVEVTKDRFVSGDPTLNPAQVLLNAMKNMAIGDKHEQELIAARKKINELEAEIEDFARAQKKPK